MSEELKQVLKNAPMASLQNHMGFRGRRKESIAVVLYIDEIDIGLAQIFPFQKLDVYLLISLSCICNQSLDKF